MLAPPFLVLLATLAGVVAAERLVASLGWSADLTFERRYALADATLGVVGDIDPAAPVGALLFCEQFDPRCRSTWLLLRTLAESGAIEHERRDLDAAVEEADRFGISSSNTVVLHQGPRFQTVERPSEGALLEALQRLLLDPERVLYVPRGEGEGDLQRGDDVGYSGLAAQLEAEGYRVRDLILAHVDEVPEDAAGVLLLSPERGIRDRGRAALERYLQRGGRLVALLEPGRESGLEALLEDWGFELPDRLVVDPASGPVEGDPPGVNPIVHIYEDHPVVHGLGRTRMTFLRRARPVLLGRKPSEGDRIRVIAYTSDRGWLTEVDADPRTEPAPAEREIGNVPLVGTGRYPREGGEARIVVVGDADFASNRYARSLYNLDLVLNAVHWATEERARIVLRPKGFAPNQFPLTPQETLRMFYGVGLLLPELLLVAAGLAWLRRRSG